MTAPLSLAFGSDAVPFEFNRSPDLLTLKNPPVKMNPARFERELNAFLDKTVLDLRQTAVVVADKTRLCGYPQYLSLMLSALDARAAKPQQLKVFIAYGTHAPQRASECHRAYGAAYQHYQWVHHDCRNRSAFVSLGRTQRGTPVVLRRDILDATSLVTFGAVVHHYFAGFGGGRKLVFPGLGYKEAIYANHGLFLDRGRRCLAAGCRAGQLKDNPLAQDLAEYESCRPADMAVHGILDTDGQVCDLMIGCGEDHFLDACRRHAGHYEYDDERQYDLVLASCGGYPKDINFIQSHKAVHNAAAFVRDGGHLLVLAQCRDGIGSQTFLPWFDLGGWEAAFDRLAAGYEGNGGTALAMMAKSKRIRISMVTDMDSSVAERIGFARLTATQAQALVRQHSGSLAVIPNASLLVKKPDRYGDAI